MKSITTDCKKGVRSKTSKHKPNIILITIDSLRYDVLSQEFFKKLNEFGNVFSCTALTAGMPTYYAFPAILGGVYPFKYGLRIGVPSSVPLVSEVFKNNGYATLGYSGGNSYTSKFAGYNKGFITFRDYMGNPAKQEKQEGKFKQFLKKIYKDSKFLRNAYNSAIQIRKALKILVNRFFPVPDASALFGDVFKDLHEIQFASFFIWIHLMDVHEPYLPIKLKTIERLKRSFVEPKRARLWMELIAYLRKDMDKSCDERAAKFIEKMRKVHKYSDFLKSLYMNALKALEDKIIDFVDEIHRKYPNTYFVITSDHGEEFFDYTTYGHFPLFHNDAVVKVPLVIVGDDLPVSNVDVPVSNLDIGPTVCGIANIPYPSEWDGMSLITPTQREKILTESIFGYVPPAIVEKVKGYSDLIISVHDSKNGSASYLFEKGYLVKKDSIGSYSYDEKFIEVVTKEINKLRKMKSINRVAKRLRKV